MNYEDASSPGKLLQYAITEAHADEEEKLHKRLANQIEMERGRARTTAFTEFIHVLEMILEEKVTNTTDKKEFINDIITEVNFGTGIYRK